jgi:hypothetical protein
MTQMKKALSTLAIASVAALVFSGCGYDGEYRYECQDPENWEAEECNPPLCKVDGTCWKDLIGFDPEDNEE